MTNSPVIETAGLGLSELLLDNTLQALWLEDMFRDKSNFMVRVNHRVVLPLVSEPRCLQHRMTYLLHNPMDRLPDVTDYFCSAVY